MKQKLYTQHFTQQLIHFLCLPHNYNYYDN